MSDRTIIGGFTRLSKMLATAEKQLAQHKRECARYVAMQEDLLCQMRVALDDAAVMLGVIPQPGSAPNGEGQRELPPEGTGSDPQATFTANGGNGGDHPTSFHGADV